MEELPAIRWSTKLTPVMDRAEQARRYADAVSTDALKRQVRAHREALPPRKRKAN